MNAEILHIAEQMKDAYEGDPWFGRNTKTLLSEISEEVALIWPEFKGRDGARTPMVWEVSNQNGGFSPARPWLPVSPVHLPLAAGAQEGQEGSMLEHYRRALAFRRRHPALRIGAQSPMIAAGEVVEFVRTGGGEQVFVAANLGESTGRAILPPGDWRLAGPGLGVDVIDGTTEVTLGPWQLCLMVKLE